MSNGATVALKFKFEGEISEKSAPPCYLAFGYSALLSEFPFSALVHGPNAIYFSICDIESILSLDVTNVSQLVFRRTHLDRSNIHYQICDRNQTLYPAQLLR